MMEEWLIDGYNLLHAYGPQKKSSKFSREALFGLLADFASSGDRKIAIILDGKGDDQEFKAYETRSFRVMYSQSMTADSVIEKILYEQKGKSLFVVVTQDRAVTQVARGSGARVIKPKEFMEMVKMSTKDRADILFHEKVRSHGFNRPFEKKLKPPVE